MDNTELYKILGVKKNASSATIKKAFRKKAKTMHPDQGGDPEEFKKLMHAYEVLTDPLKRARYNSGKDYSDDYQAGLIQYILSVFTNIITDSRISNNLNILDIVAQKIQGDRKQCLDIIGGIKSKQKELRTYNGKIKRKGEGENIFQSFITQKLSDLDVAILDHQKKIEFYNEAQEILTVYEYHGPVAEPDPWSAMLGATGTAYTHTFRFVPGV